MLKVPPESWVIGHKGTKPCFIYQTGIEIAYRKHGIKKQCVKIYVLNLQDPVVLYRQTDT